MKDYKNRTKYNTTHAKLYAPKSKKALPPPKKKGGGKVPYSFKFYAVIIGTVLCSFFYIKYQIDNKTDSVFPELYKLVQLKFETSFLSTKKKVKTNIETLTDKTEEELSQLKEEKNGGKESIAETSVIKTNTVTKPRPATASPVTQTRKPVTESKPKHPSPQNVLQNKVIANTKTMPLFVPYRSEQGIKMVEAPSQTVRDDSYHEAVDRVLRFQSEKKEVLGVFSSAVSLRKAWVENDVLLLDFDSDFEYNRYGKMGVSLQIQQILWSIFSYSDLRKDDINSISFLINGERKTKIGGEGIPLKLFYTRKDLVKVITREENG